MIDILKSNDIQWNVVCKVMSESKLTIIMIELVNH
jgi:hypothetical protein